MVRLLKQLLSDEKGQALPIVLSLLAIGGLTIAASLSYCTTALKGSQIVREDMNGVYAAGAGVEHALWSVKNTILPLTELPGNINRMGVNIKTEVKKENYTLYLGTLVETGKFCNYLDVDGVMAWDEGRQAYEYTITVEITPPWQGEGGNPKVFLDEVGARLPPGYGYTTGPGKMPGPLDTSDPDLPVPPGGARQVQWLWSGGGRPMLWDSPQEDQRVMEVTQAFYLAGQGSTEGEYAWVVASGDIGTVSEVTGKIYKITATAKRPEDGRRTAEIVADVVLESSGKIHILSWRITS